MLFAILNFFAVLCFGILLTLSFAGISIRRNKKQVLFITVAFGLLQGGLSFLSGYETLFKLYPLLTHVPLFFLLKSYFGKSGYFAGIAVLSAYLFCTPRKWFGTALSSFWNYDMNVSYFVQIVLTLPLLLLIIKFVSPYVARLELESSKILRLFLISPLVYYILEYTLTVYTSLLYEGGPAVVEFMDSAVVIVYFIFSIIYLKTFYEKNRIEVENAVLNMMSDNFHREIEALKKSERLHAIYRHDLRHHMNYLNACILENKCQEATEYIRQTFDGMDNRKPEHYSDNESLNLILSSYIGKAREQHIPTEIHITAAAFERFQIIDLCSLLANALENAIKACVQTQTPDKCFIRLRMYEKNNKLCIQLRNSYGAKPVLEHGIPVSRQEGHGLGVKSMIYIIEKYKGIYNFSAQNGVFTFQVSM